MTITHYIIMSVVWAIFSMKTAQSSGCHFPFFRIMVSYYDSLYRSKDYINFLLYIINKVSIYSWDIFAEFYMSKWTQKLIYKNLIYYLLLNYKQLKFALNEKMDWNCSVDLLYLHFVSCNANCLQLINKQAKIFIYQLLCLFVSF